MPVGVAATLVLAYLVGSFPTARVVARRWGHDPTAEGSGNPGASNVYRVAGRRAGVIVLLGDVVKGAACAGAGFLVAGAGPIDADPRLLGLACGAAAVVGHTMPLRGRGGKGVATTGGVVIVLYPIVAAVALLGWIVLARLVDKASVASLVTAIGVPILVALTGAPRAEVVGVAVLSAYVIARHASNIIRLVRGEERSLHSSA